MSYLLCKYKFRGPQLIRQNVAWHVSALGPELQRNVYVRNHISYQQISNPAPDWLAAQQPANPTVCEAIFVN